MNLVKAADLLKGASDDILKRYLANPTGEFPEYLVASEIKRRDDMRKRYAAEMEGRPEKTSIIEEILHKKLDQIPPQQSAPPPQMPPEAMGIGSVPPPPGLQMTPAPMMAAAQQAPQQMYDGGVVALAGGGLLDEMEKYLGVEKADGGIVGYADGGAVNPYAINQDLITQQAIPDVGTLESYGQQASQMLGPSGLTGYEDYLRQEKEDLAKKRGNYLSDFLINAGLSMAASKRLDPLGAAAEGAAQGFAFYQKSKQQDNEAERNMREAQFKFQQAQRAERAGVLGVSQKLYDTALSQRNQAIDNNRAAEQMRVNSVRLAEQSKIEAKKLGISERELAIRAAEAKRNADVSQAQIGLLQSRMGLYNKQAEQVGKPRPPSIKEITEARSTIMMGRPYQDMRKRLMKDAGSDPVKAAIVESQLAQWVDSQIPKTAGVYTGPTDSE